MSRASRLIALPLLLGLATLACSVLSTPPTEPVPEPSLVPTWSPSPEALESLTPEPTATTPAEPLPPGWLTYQNDGCDFQLVLPPDSTVTTLDAATDQIDLPFTPGSNLQEKYLQVACRAVATACASPLAEGYAPGSLASEPREFNGTSFTFQTAGEGAAGSFYVWSDYSTTAGGPCLSLSFVLHSTNAMNYDPPLAEFDNAAESAVFEGIMGTFHWVSP
jgi:hypothetical protein